jgi:hypothetical protein
MIHLPEGGPMSCCIPFSRMLVFPSAGRRKTPTMSGELELEGIQT